MSKSATKTILPPDLEDRWYVALGRLPEKIQIHHSNNYDFFAYTAQIVPRERLFLTEAEALDFALDEADKARQNAEARYQDLLLLKSRENSSPKH